MLNEEIETLAERGLIIAEKASAEGLVAEEVVHSYGPVDTRVEEGLRLRHELAEQAARTAHLEIVHLKKLLAEQDMARKHAQRAAAQAQRHMKGLETDANRLRDELARARELHAQAKQEHSVDVRQAADREAGLMAELVEARHRATKAVDSASGYRHRWLAIALCIAVPSVAGLALGWGKLLPGGWGMQTGGEKQTEAVTAPPVESVRPWVPKPLGASGGKVQPQDLSGALGTLDDALDRFRGISPEEVLHRAHKENLARGVSVCSFEWNSGRVSLVFGGGETEDPESSIVHCADAVNHLAGTPSAAVK